MKELYYKLMRWWFPTYKLTVSYNAIFGDADDTTYIVRKFYTKQEKYLNSWELGTGSSQEDL
mgnify:CR=1 FL=1